MDDGEELTLTLPAVTSSIPAGRRTFGQWLEQRCDGGVVDELEVVFSELLANAVTASDDATDIDVRATHHHGHVFLDVANVPDRGGVAMQRWDLSDDLRAGGRGLLIVSALVDDIEVTRRDGVVAVCCRRRVD